MNLEEFLEQFGSDEDLLRATEEDTWDVSQFSLSHRAMIAKRISDALRGREAVLSKKKADWIQKARVEFAPGERKPCAICHRFRGIAEAHHVAPLGIQYDMGIRKPIQKHVWLCPSHHAVVHIGISSRMQGLRHPFVDGVSVSELDESEKLAQYGLNLIVYREQGNGV